MNSTTSRRHPQTQSNGTFSHIRAHREAENHVHWQNMPGVIAHPNKATDGRLYMCTLNEFPCDAEINNKQQQHQQQHESGSARTAKVDMEESPTSIMGSSQCPLKHAESGNAARSHLRGRREGTRTSILRESRCFVEKKC